MNETMTPARYIRVHVFGVETQREFAALLGYKAPTISRFEQGRPITAVAQKRIRALAEARGAEWDNNWFFEVPKDFEDIVTNGQSGESAKTTTTLAKAS